MGIKHLNQYFTKKCSSTSIKKIHFEDLYDKIIVIDISIYMYRFLGDGIFMENMYLFLSLLKYLIM